MKYISIIICLALFSCHDVKVGYLETEVAQYNPNVLEVTKSQDANDPYTWSLPPSRVWKELNPSTSQSGR